MLSSALLSPEYQVEEDSSLKATPLDNFTNLGVWIYRPDQLLPIPSTISGDQLAQLSVLIPQRHLCYTNPNVLKRKLWGTGIYTDDSDLVAVLLHSGSIKPTFPHPLLQESPSSEKQQQQEIWNGMMVDYYGKTEGEALVKACQSFPLFTTTMDLLVNVCVLPCLREYPGTVQNYIKSRSWGLDESIHHGLSIKILSVQSLEGPAPVITSRHRSRSSSRSRRSHHSNSSSSNSRHRRRKEGMQAELKNFIALKKQFHH